MSQRIVLKVRRVTTTKLKSLPKGGTSRRPLVLIVGSHVHLNCDYQTIMIVMIDMMDMIDMIEYTIDV